MTNYPDSRNESEATLLKIKKRDDEIKNLNYQTRKHDYDNILKSLKRDNEYFKKKQKSVDKKKIFMIVSEILFGIGGIGVDSGLTIPGIAPVGMVTASSISFLSSISTLITMEYFSKIKYDILK